MAVRHPQDPGEVGLAVTRTIPRANRVDAWPALDPAASSTLTQPARVRVTGSLPRAGGVDLIPELTRSWSDTGVDDARWSRAGFAPAATR